MLQRIGLAQALINDPDLVILDEPMSGLDPIGRRDVRDLILDLKRRGRTVFFSTHILSDTELICDRVGMLVRGSLKAVGAVEDLVRAGTPFWEVTLRWAADQPPPVVGQVRSRREDRILVRVENEADLHRLVASLNGNSRRLVSVSPARQSLEISCCARCAAHRVTPARAISARAMSRRAPPRRRGCVMPARILAIALNTFREAIRNRILYLLLVFAVALILCAQALSLMTVGSEEKIIKDFGLATIDVFGVLTAVLLGIGWSAARSRDARSTCSSPSRSTAPSSSSESTSAWS